MTDRLRIDSATGLYTQALFEILLAHETVRTRRYPSPLVVLRLGLFSPKTASSDVLESASLGIAQLLNSGLRQVDVPAHYNDDYVVLLPATDERGGMVVGRRLLDQLGGERSTRGNRPYVLEICIGLSAHEGGHSASGTELLSQATLALEEARRRGPNTLVNYREMEINRS